MQEQGLSSSDALVSSGGAPSSVVTAAGGQPACALGSQSIFDDEVKQAQEFPDTFVESTFEDTETQATLAYEPSSASSENEPKKDLSLKFDAAASAAGSVKSPVSETAVVPSTPAITLPGSSPKHDAASIR